MILSSDALIMNSYQSASFWPVCIRHTGYKWYHNVGIDNVYTVNEKKHGNVFVIIYKTQPNLIKSDLVYSVFVNLPQSNVNVFYLSCLGLNYEAVFNRRLKRQ